MIINCFKINKVLIIIHANGLCFIKQKLELDHSVSFISIISCLAKKKPKLKHIIIKAIQCTLLNICVLLHMLQVLRDFKHLNNC